MNLYKKAHIINKLKVVVFFFVICVATFISVTPVLASQTNSSNTDNEANASTNSDSEQDTNSDQGNISGNVGPIQYNIDAGSDDSGLTSTLQILMVLTVISLAPSILIMLTSFTRIIIVLHFVRSALGLQSTPPNQILVGLALFLTFFIMSPTFSDINQNAIQPLSKGEITQEQAYEAGEKPIREFMLKQIKQPKDLKLFMNIAGIDDVTSLDEIPITVIIPSFIISELRTAFIIGFLIYIPFIVIDMVVASTLMSMGMMMLPPTTISMPFKILLFIMADGWNLIIGEVVKTFY